MAGVKLISLALCTLGVFKSIQPHWLYFDRFVSTKYPNITICEFEADILPVKDYSCLILTFLVIFITDYVKYKPIIILQRFFAVILISLLIWDQQSIPLIVAQVFHGFVMATDVAFYAYIFSIVDPEKYKLNTCLTQVSVLFGIFLGNLLAALLVTLKITGNLDTINYISFAFSIISLMVAMALPHVQPRIPTQREIIERELQTPSGLTSSDTLRKSPWEDVDVNRRPSMQSAEVQSVIDTYAHVNDPAFTAYARSNMFSDIDTSSIGFYGEYSSSERFNTSIGSETSITSRGENAAAQTEADINTTAITQSEKLNKFVKDIKKAYSEHLVIYWSLWLIMSGCGYFILQDKFTSLISEVSLRNNITIDLVVYDAGTTTLAALLGIIPVLLYGIIPGGTCSIYTDPVILVLSVLSCVVITIFSNTSNIWLMYSVYIIFYVFCQLGFVLALFLIGNILQSRRYGFIFGINLFLAMVIKLILRAILDNKHTLNLPTSTQLTVLGVLFGIFGLSFLSKIIYKIIKMYQQNGQCCGKYENSQDQNLLVAST